MSPARDLARHLGPRPWIVGHRGAAGSALENTLASIESALVRDVAMIELDVQLTADRIAVVFHDWDLRRLAGRSEIVERTEHELLEEVELTAADDGSRHAIPTLEAALAAIPPDRPVNLEIKRRFHESDLVVERLQPYLGPARPILVSSFDWNLLSAVRSAAPEQPLAPLGRYRPEALLAIADGLEAFSLHVHRELAPKLLEADQVRGRPLLAYTVNDAVEARALVSQGAAGLFTDEPARVRSALAGDD